MPRLFYNDGQSSEAVNPASSSIEERKLELEIKKFEWEKEKSSRWLNANFGVVITAIVGLGTISVSLIQLEISKEAAQSQLAQQVKTSNNQLQLAMENQKETESKDTRGFSLDLAKFLIERAGDINTNDPDRVLYFRSIFADILPADVGLPFLRRMANNASSEQMRAQWSGLYVEVGRSSSPGVLTVHVNTRISPEYVIQIFPELSAQEPKTRLNDLLAEVNGSKLRNDNEIAIFLAIIFSEVGFFTEIQEDFNYSAQRLMQVFPRSFPTVADAAAAAHNPEVIANKVYGGRMGNQAPEDGWKYRGRGYLQITGRTAYESATQLLGIDLVGNPDLLVDSKIAARQAVADYLRLTSEADRSDLVRTWIKINGSSLGAASAQALYQRLVPNAPKLTAGLINPQGDAVPGPRLYQFVP